MVISIGPGEVLLIGMTIILLALLYVLLRKAEGSRRFKEN
jgi:hypothetical protein